MLDLDGKYVKVIKDLELKEDTPLINEAKLVYISGSSKLTINRRICESPNYGSYAEMSLNKVPLIKMDVPYCPTCSSILATGYGIENADCQELKEIRSVLNEDFVSLEYAIDALNPILTLIDSGLYVIADAVCFPTDGEGDFFWGIFNEPTEKVATAGVLVPDMDYAYMNGQPVFLYPTQSTDCFNPERVEYYKEIYKEGKIKPRALIYNFSGYLSAVIDGHYKAAAASIIGDPLNAIVIIAFSNYNWLNDRLLFSDIEIKKSDIPPEYLPNETEFKLKKSYDDFNINDGSIIKRNWENIYIYSAKQYPDVYEYAEFMAILEYAYENGNCELCELIKVLIKGDKQTEIKCINTYSERIKYKLKVYAARRLSFIKNDKDVEKAFIDYLVKCEDQNDAVKRIIDKYWD